MARVDGPPQTFVISEQAVTAALATPPTQETVITTAPLAPVVAAETFDAAEQSHREPSRKMPKWLAGVVLGGSLMLGGAAQAEASPTDTTAAQSQESDTNWTTIGSVGVAALAVVTTSVMSSVALRNNTREKEADRFNAALQGIKGDSTGEERMARLNALEPFAGQKRFRTVVNRAAATYLRGRRGSLEILRKNHAGDPEGYDHAVTERRNSDRSALKLFHRTLDAARQEVRREVFAKRIKRFLNIRDDMDKLADLTGIFREPEKPLVNARGINLDEMRDIAGYNLHGLDLTGAGLQRNQITNVSFRGSRLNEVQLDGTIIASSDLRGTDLRAAYFEGATIEECVIDEDTQFGNLPDNHPKAKFGGLDPEKANTYRGDTHIILKNLISDTLTPEEIVQKVHEWQRGGLTLLEGSNAEYFLNPNADADPSQQPL